MIAMLLLFVLIIFIIPHVNALNRLNPNGWM